MKSSLSNKSSVMVQPVGWQTLMIVISSLITGSLVTYSVVGYQLTTSTPAPTITPQEETVRAVAALGYIEPKEAIIKLSAPISIQEPRIEKLLVKRGDQVKAGQLIAILDSYDRLLAAYQETQTQVKVAQAHLAQVQAGSKTGDVQAQDAKFQQTLAELEGQMAAQEALIASLKAQLQGEQITQTAVIKRFQAELSNAQNECKRYETLYQQGAVSEQDRDRSCLQQKISSESLQEAQATLNMTVSTLQAQITKAQAELVRTQETLNKQLQEDRATLAAVAEVRPVDVQVAQAQLESAQATAQRAKADLNLAYVRSPQNGQILKIHAWPGEKVGDEGILELGQTAQMYVRAEIYETDINQIRVGQLVTITSNGVIEDLYGIVDEIGLQIDKQKILGTDPAVDADARVVEVKIRLRPEDSQRVANLTNLQVNVIIDTSL